jgi:Family of unknown function (DUF6401)
MNWLGQWYESVARRELAALSRRVFDRIDITPGVRAAIDQHAAAVRDVLAVSPGRIGPVELAGYARGVEDAAVRDGWCLPAGANSRHDWVSLRLAATCLLAAASSTALVDLPQEPASS